MAFNFLHHAHGEKAAKDEDVLLHTQKHPHFISGAKFQAPAKHTTDFMADLPPRPPALKKGYFFMRDSVQSSSGAVRGINYSHTISSWDTHIPPGPLGGKPGQQ